jgi:hypothetical protein
MAPGVVRAGPVEYRPWRPAGWGLLFIAAALGGMLLGVGLAAFWPRGPVGSSEYQIWRWEASTLLDNAFARVGIGPDPTDAEGREVLQAYFGLTTEIRAQAAADPPNLEAISRLMDERAEYENQVERLIERYIDEAVSTEGLQRSLPLFDSVEFTWPPVDFELTNPPQLLVRSPRSVIRRDGDILLKNDLGLAEIQRLEAKTSNDEDVTVVISIGGLAAYPAIVHADRPYSTTLNTAAHEWVHHYLAFFPLGEQWGKGGDAHTLNETTAELAGDEIARLIADRHPVEFPDGRDGRGPAGKSPTLDFNETMHALRLEVDDLLAQGKVSDAEALMEQKRLELNAAGYNIRKINQAYFAFHGTYAESPQSSDPIGPKVREVWERTEDVGVFLAIMRNVESVQDLDGAIATLEVLGGATAAP